MGRRFIILVKFQRFMPPSFEYLQGWRFQHLFGLVLVKISLSSSFFSWFLIRISWVSALVHCFSSFQCGSLRSLWLPLPHSLHGVVGYSLGLLFWRHPITSVTLHWPHSSTSDIPVHSSCPDTGVVTQQQHKTLYTAVRQQNVSNVLFFSYFCRLMCDLSS